MDCERALAVFPPGFSKGQISTFSEALTSLANFIERASKEWKGYITLSGLEYLGRFPIQPFDKILVEDFLDSIAITKARIIFEIISGKDASNWVIEALSLKLSKGNHHNIVPIVTDGNYEESAAMSAGKYGTPLFSKVRKTNGLVFGVFGAITLNIPRAANETKEENALLDKIGSLMESAIHGLESKHKQLQTSMKNGELPLTSQLGLEGFAGSLGIVGVHEALTEVIGKGIDSKPGKAVSYKILEYMLDRAKELEPGSGFPILIHAHPVDDAPYRLAELDKKANPEITTSGSASPFYTKSTELPVNYTDDLWDALEHQKRLQSMYTGGTMFNIPLAAGIDEAAGLGILARKIEERFELPCFAFSPTYSICPEHGYIKGRAIMCPTCSKETKVYSRLEYTYEAEDTLGSGEKEELRLRRPYAVASDW